MGEKEKLIRGFPFYKMPEKPVFVFLFFALLSIGLYSNSFNSSFHYDDYRNIVDNTYLHWDTLSTDSIKKIFIKTEGNPYDRPLASLTFAINYYFCGLDVKGYHAVNVMIHIFTAFGLFLFLRRVFSLPLFKENLRERCSYIAFLASLLWLSSPLQTQAVVYIVQRMAGLAAMFYVFSMYFYLRGRTGKGREKHLFYTLTLIFTLLAFGSKQNAYTLPLYFIIFEIIIIRGGNTAFLFNKKLLLSFFVIGGIFVAIILYLHYIPLETRPGSWFLYLIKTRFYTGMRVIVFYFIQLLFPLPSILSLEHDFSISRSLLDPKSTLPAVVFVAVLTVYAFKSFRRYPLFSFFSIWFLGNLVIETFYPRTTVVFEHRLYLPSMGYFALFAIFIEKINRYFKETRFQCLLISLLLITLSFFAVNTYLRNLVWEDEYTLWSDVINKSPNIGIGHTGLAAYYLKNNDYKKAVSYYLKAKYLEPRNAPVRFGLGVAYFNLKMYDKSVAEFAYLGSMGYEGVEKKAVNYYFSEVAWNLYADAKDNQALEVLDKALYFDPENSYLAELRKKIKEGTITYKEIKQE